MDISRCKPVDATSVDCTEALAENARAPSFHRVLFAPNQDLRACALLRVTTAAKNTALQNASGIGFWSTQIVGGNQAAEDAGRFIPREQLKATGTATLKSGDSATLYEFVGVLNCPANGLDQVARLFKPYMEFPGANGSVFHNWDLASNYLISRSIPRFDRSADALRQ